MSRHTNDDLIHELARDLPPVTAIARLRVAAAKLLLLWLCALAVRWWLDGSGPGAALDGLSGDWSHWSVWIGLAVLAGGALLAALAGAVPGRERVAGAGRAVAVLGIAWVVGSGLWGLAGAESVHAEAALADSFACAGYAIALGIPSLWFAAAFMLRGAPASPRMDSTVAAVGAVALGAFAVHAACSITSGEHVLLGHCLTPVVAAGLISLPLAARIARASRAGSGPVSAN